MQIDLPMTLPAATSRRAARATEIPVPDLHSYDYILLMFSGGKDSSAALLHLLEQGVAPEIWHHDIDGAGRGEGEHFMDWPVTSAYCEAVAEHFELPFYLSYREGGFERELLKTNDRTAPVVFETPEGTFKRGGKNGKIATRRRFPQVGADLRTRWCSSTLKIEVAAAAIAGQDRFKGKRTLVVTGERAEESSNRARYADLEPHRTHAVKRAKRHVDHWRPVLRWSEAEIWAIMERHKLEPHPCYHLHFGRASCARCIFLGADSMNAIRRIDPGQFSRLAALEQEFGVTIKRDISAHALADKGQCLPLDEDMVQRAQSTSWDIPVINEDWVLPVGAFAETSGPS